MKKKSTHNPNSLAVFLIFLLFFIILCVQHHFAWLYQDDYGYGSLSYVSGYGIMGHDYSASQLFTFLGNHYINWGGRILYFAIECILLRFGIHAWRIFQSLAIVMIFFCIYLVIQKSLPKIKKWKVALLTVVTYGIISIAVARDGIFWLTASVLYLVPLLPFFTFFYLYNFTNLEHNLFCKIIMCVLVFLSTFSYEQTSTMVVFLMLLNLVWNWIKNKRCGVFDLILTIVSIIGFSILMLSPGNAIRMSHPTSVDFYALPFIERVLFGLSSILSHFFSPDNAIFLFFFTGGSILSSFYAYAYMKKKYKNRVVNIFNVLVSSSCMLLFVLCIIFQISTGFYNTVISLFKDNQLLSTLITIMVAIQCLLVIYSYTAALCIKKAFTLAKLPLCMLVSLCVMVMAPYFPYRALLVPEMVFFPVIIYLILSYSSKLPLNTDLFIYLGIMIIFFVNVGYITIGYYKNDYANQYNDSVLSETSKKIKDGDNIVSVSLMPMNNDLFSGDQPYNNNSYILFWMKKYYDLPEDLEIIYGPGKPVLNK